MQYKDRVFPLTQVPFDKFWNETSERLLGDPKKRNAWALARTFDRMFAPPEAAEYTLGVAVYLWLEAAHAIDFLHAPERGWAALVRCQYYLGMASCPETLLEANARGGLKSWAELVRIRNRAAELVRGFNSGQFRTKKEAIEAIAPEIESMISLTAFTGKKRTTDSEELVWAERSYRKVTSAVAILTKWSCEWPYLHEQFERVVVGGVKRGRKKKSDTPTPPVGNESL